MHFNSGEGSGSHETVWDEMTPCCTGPNQAFPEDWPSPPNVTYSAPPPIVVPIRSTSHTQACDGNMGFWLKGWESLSLLLPPRVQMPGALSLWMPEVSLVVLLPISGMRS